MKTARLLLPTLALALALSQPAAAHHTPSHNVCSPVYKCLFGSCWYDLLNNSEFNGTPAACTNWSGASVAAASQCWNSNSASLTSGAGGFTQNFTVPADADTLEVALEFATVGGTPSSASDQIILDLYENGFLIDSITINTQNSSTSCHREDHSFGSGFAGKSLQLRVRAQFFTSGISYRINWIQIFGT